MEARITHVKHKALILESVWKDLSFLSLCSEARQGGCVHGNARGYDVIMSTELTDREIGVCVYPHRAFGSHSS